MKKIFILCIMLYNTVYAQPLIDIEEGSSFSYKKFTKGHNELFMYDWSGICKNEKSRYHILKQKNKKNLIEYQNKRNCDVAKEKKKKRRKKEKKKSYIYIPGSQIYRKSEIDDSIHNIYYIYNNEVMLIKVKKNLAGVRLIFKEIKFRKGDFEINFKKIAQKYKYIAAKTPKYFDKNIVIDTFPFE